ncbi:hypothetical protein Pmani_023454 [Petrolisthes manimaculis]|uniref:Uncharacterized protein n=1 Tax=Petrolisthes manimaculis TaxID=1843537 RepID=A0AAE1P9I8_9EUCA|nr:hypothetical protein Pmani_023454 [Petrolisthes manimaculis]
MLRDVHVVGAEHVCGEIETINSDARSIEMIWTWLEWSTWVRRGAISGSDARRVTLRDVHVAGLQRVG